MEDTNWPKDCIKVVWEVLPSNDEFIFREISLQDIDPTLFYPDQPIDTEKLPTIPYPIFDLAPDCLDRVWTQTTIKINTETLDTEEKTDPENIRVFDINENHKGLICPFSLNSCQEGWCQGCCVYLDRYI